MNYPTTRSQPRAAYTRFCPICKIETKHMRCPMCGTETDEVDEASGIRATDRVFYRDGTDTMDGVVLHVSRGGLLIVRPASGGDHMLIPAANITASIQRL